MISLGLNGLKANHKYYWKVVINNDWKENYGLNGQLNANNANADFTTSAQGEIRLIFRVNPVNLLNDYNIDSIPTVPTEPTPSTIPGETTSTRTTTTPVTRPTTPAVTLNPVKPCSLASCPSCNNAFSSKLIRATGKFLSYLIYLKY